MRVISRKSEVLINGVKTKIEDVVATLKYLPSGEIVTFFNNLQMTMPRRARISALHAVLDDKVTDEENVKKFSDEVNYRLKWYHTFSEHQLEGILVLLSNVNYENQFREELWLTFLKLHEELKIDVDALTGIYEIAKGYKNSPREGITEFERGIDQLFFDEKGEVDGLSYADFREVLKNSSTLVELREIGAKYDVDVPRRIKKNDLVDIILDEMTTAGTLTPDVEERVKRMSVMSLQRFAKDNKIKASIELKKEDIIEYIIGRVETEVEKSNVDLGILDVAEEAPAVAAPVVEEPVVEKEDGELKQEITDLKSQIAMLVLMQQEMLNKQSEGPQIVKETDPTVIAELERIRVEKEHLEAALEEQKAANEKLAQEQEEAERLAQEQAALTEQQAAEKMANDDAEEDARIAAEKEALANQLEAERNEKQSLADQLEAERLEKERIAAEAAERLEAERLEKERIAAEAAEKLEAERLEKERIAAEAAEQERIAKEKEEFLNQQLDSRNEASNINSDDFVIPDFDSEEPVEEPKEEESIDDFMSLDDVMGVEEPVEEKPVVEEEPIVEEPAYVEETNFEEEPVFEPVEEEVQTPSEEEELDALMFDDVEEKKEDFEAPTFDSNSFEAPVYQETDDETASFDNPTFDTPIFEAPVFEAPVYGDQRKSNVNRRLTFETKTDKKRRQAEEKALQEALKADAKFSKRRKKRGFLFKLFKWLLILLVILVIAIIALGLVGASGNLPSGFLYDIYDTIKEGIADVIEKVTGYDMHEVYRGIKDLFNF